MTPPSSFDCLCRYEEELASLAALRDAVKENARELAVPDDGGLDVEMLRKYGAAMQAPGDIRDSAQTMVLQSDAMRSLARRAVHATESAAELAHAAHSYIRTESFRPYEGVDKPSSLLRNMAKGGQSRK